MYILNDSNHDGFLYMRKNISLKFNLHNKSKVILALVFRKSTQRCDISSLSCFLDVSYYFRIIVMQQSWPMIQSYIPIFPLKGITRLNTKKWMYVKISWVSQKLVRYSKPEGTVNYELNDRLQKLSIAKIKQW